MNGQEKHIEILVVKMEDILATTTIVGPHMMSRDGEYQQPCDIAFTTIQSCKFTSAIVFP